MHRIPLDLISVKAARDLRSGTDRESVCSELGISPRNIESIECHYGNVSDALLARIERLLDERDRLRHLISNLLQRDQ